MSCAKSEESQHYAGVGSVYYINANSQLDARVTFGINNHADDFLTGAGLGIRYSELVVPTVSYRLRLMNSMARNASKNTPATTSH